jgi:hypothetical protein
LAAVFADGAVKLGEFDLFDDIPFNTGITVGFFRCPFAGAAP